MCDFSALGLDYLVDQSERLCFLGGHKVVTLRSLGYNVDGLAGTGRQHLVELFAGLDYVIGVILTSLA